MDSDTFDAIVSAQLDICKEMLISKASEYAVDTDRLHNFRVAAKLQGVPMPQALGGMMAKHTISIYDMIYADHEHTPDLWQEKITDHINYLLLLRAMITEDNINKLSGFIPNIEDTDNA